MILFAILVTTALAGHFPDHHHHHPPPPLDFLRNLTREVQREFFEIIHADDLTFAEIDEKASKWASENNVTEEFARFQQEHKKLEEQENQNVTNAIEKLKNIQGQINDVITNKNQTREDEHDAIEKLRRRNPWEVDTVLHIRRPPPPPREDDQNLEQQTLKLDGLRDALRRGEFGYGNYFNQQRGGFQSGGDFEQRGFRRGDFQPRPSDDFEPRGSQRGDFQQRHLDDFEPRTPQRGDFQPRGSQRGDFQLSRRDNFEPRTPQRGEFQSRLRDNFQPRPYDDFEPRGNQRGEFQPRPRNDFEPRGNQRGEFQPRPRDDFEPRGNQRGEFQPRPRDEFEQGGPQRQDFHPRPYDDFEPRGSQRGDFQPRPLDDFEPRQTQPGDFQQSREPPQWIGFPRMNQYQHLLSQPDNQRQQFGQNSHDYDTITDDENAMRVF